MARRHAYQLTETAAPARDRVYVVARTGGGRPTLQHLLPPSVGSVTACGLDISRWSRAYTHQSIPQILCLRGACRA